jgi:hypothetical protein
MATKSKSSVTKQSAQSAIMTEASSLVGFIKDQIKQDISSANTQLELNLDSNQLRRLSSLLEGSIERSFSRGSNGLLQVASKSYVEK